MRLSTDGVKLLKSYVERWKLMCEDPNAKPATRQQIEALIHAADIVLNAHGLSVLKKFGNAHDYAMNNLLVWQKAALLDKNPSALRNLLDQLDDGQGAFALILCDDDEVAIQFSKSVEDLVTDVRKSFAKYVHWEDYPHIKVGLTPTLSKKVKIGYGKNLADLKKILGTLITNIQVERRIAIDFRGKQAEVQKMNRQLSDDIQTTYNGYIADFSSSEVIVPEEYEAFVFAYKAKVEDFIQQIEALPIICDPTSLFEQDGNDGTTLPRQFSSFEQMQTPPLLYGVDRCSALLYQEHKLNEALIKKGQQPVSHVRIVLHDKIQVEFQTVEDIISKFEKNREVYQRVGHITLTPWKNAILGELFNAWVFPDFDSVMQPLANWQSEDELLKTETISLTHAYYTHINFFARGDRSSQ